MKKLVLFRREIQKYDPETKYLSPIIFARPANFLLQDAFGDRRDAGFRFVDEEAALFMVSEETQNGSAGEDQRQVQRYVLYSKVSDGCRMRGGG